MECYPDVLVKTIIKQQQQKKKRKKKNNKHTGKTPTCGYNKIVVECKSNKCCIPSLQIWFS